jgi:hypothetical protein
MPNGEERNWIRLCGAIDGFRSTYKKWPSKIKVFDGFISEMRDHVLGPENYAILIKYVELIEDGSPIVAEDDDGNQYSYGEVGFPSNKPDITTKEWIGIDCII